MRNQRTIVEIHIIETVGPSNINRDDTGSPKVVEYGGVTRARVSSQAWKRPTREMFAQSFDQSDLGIRTKRVVEELVKRITDVKPEADRQIVVKLAETIIGDCAGIKLSAPRTSKKDSDREVLQETGYLLFLGGTQYDALASIAIEALENENPVAAVKKQKKVIKNLVSNDKAVDVALFGRMVADDVTLNVDAAAQVAHAISVHAVESESDFFTAVDDLKQQSDDESDAGAGMMGDVEFNAPTMYRFADVDVDRLNDTLQDSNVTAKAISTFIKAFVTSMPTGKQNTFADHPLPELVLVNVRDTQAVSLVGAFERPVEPNYVEHATEALVQREQEFDAAYGVTPVHSWIIRVGNDTKAVEKLHAETLPLQGIADAVSQMVVQRLSQE